MTQAVKCFARAVTTNPPPARPPQRRRWAHRGGAAGRPRGLRGRSHGAGGGPVGRGRPLLRGRRPAGHRRGRPARPRARRPGTHGPDPVQLTKPVIAAIGGYAAGGLCSRVVRPPRRRARRHLRRLLPSVRRPTHRRRDIPCPNHRPGTRAGPVLPAAPWARTTPDRSRQPRRPARAVEARREASPPAARCPRPACAAAGGARWSSGSSRSRHPCPRASARGAGPRGRDPSGAARLPRARAGAAPPPRGLVPIAPGRPPCAASAAATSPCAMACAPSSCSP